MPSAVAEDTQTSDGAAVPRHGPAAPGSSQQGLRAAEHQHTIHLAAGLCSPRTAQPCAATRPLCSPSCPAPPAAHTTAAPPARRAALQSKSKSTEAAPTITDRSSPAARHEMEPAAIGTQSPELLLPCPACPSTGEGLLVQKLARPINLMRFCSQGPLSARKGTAPQSARGALGS